MKIGRQKTCKIDQKISSKKRVDFFCPLVKHLYKDLNYRDFLGKTGIFALVLFLFSAGQGYSALTITPGAPPAITIYGNELNEKIGASFNINIAANATPNIFDVSVSKISEEAQNVKLLTYQVQVNASTLTVLSGTIAAEFSGATPAVRYTGAKLFDGMKMIFPASDPVVEITQMILRSKNVPTADEVSFESKGRYWKILTGSASEDAVDDQHFHGGGTISDQIKHGEHEKMLELISYIDVTHRIIKSGNWSDASIWENGLVPQTGSKVFVGEGLTVTVDGEFMTQVPFTVRIDGVIRFKTNVNTGLKLRTLVVNAMGSFYMGEGSDRIKTGVTAQILVADRGIRDAAARLRDPLDMDGGVIAHGKIFNMFGEEKTGHAIPNEILQTGLSQLSFTEAPVGWHVGDTLVFPTTADPVNTYEIPDEDETIKITAISGDGKIFTLERALQYNHLAPSGVRDPKNPARLLGIPVGNLTRNAFFKSEVSYLPPVKPAIPLTIQMINEVRAGLERRGHFMVMHAQSGVLIDGAGFYDLGRTNARIGSTLTAHTIPVLDAEEHVVPGTDTNSIGRYALHIHGRTGADALKNPIRISNCAITRSPKHGLVNHGGHVIATGNVTYDIAGAHFFAENGSEIGAFIHNLAIGSKGPNPGNDGFLMTGAFNTLTNNGTLYAFDVGGNGFGFWMEGHGIRILDNYAFHHRNSGFAYYALGLKEGLKNCKDMGCAEWAGIPYIGFQVSNMDVRDADGNVDPEKAALKNQFIAEGKTSVAIQAVPVTFARNVGGAVGTGLFASYIQTSITQNSYYNKIHDSVFWGNVHTGLNTRYSRRVLFQNIILIKEPTGVNFAKNPDYRARGGGSGGNEHTQDIIYDRLHIEGYASGINMPIFGNNVVKDSYLKNRINIIIPAPKAEGNMEGFPNGDDRRITIQNVRFEALNQKGGNNEPSLDIYFAGRFIQDNPALGFDPTLWLSDRNNVEIIGQDVNALRIGSDHVPTLFYDRFNIILVSPKFTNQLTGYVAEAKRTAYPTLASIFSAPVTLNEGWNLVPIIVPAWTSDPCCGGNIPQERFLAVFGDTTPPTFVPDPQIPLIIDSNRLSEGFLLMGKTINQTGNIRSVENFSHNFTNLTVSPDGKVWLRSSALSAEERKALKDQAGNTAEFQIPLTVREVAQYVLTVAAAGTGTGTITKNPDQASYIAGTVVQVTAVPSADSVFSGWTIGSTTESASTLNLTMNADQNMTANFTLNTYKINAIAGVGGMIDPKGYIAVNSGANQSFTVSPNPGYAIKEVRVDSVSKGAITSFDFTNVTAAHSILAVFQAVYTLNVTSAGTGAGVITKNPDQASYNAGTVVQLTAVPSVNSTFTGWTVGGVTNTAGSLSVTMDANQSISANFALISTDASILAGLEKAIREHPYASYINGGTNLFPGFDLNEDTRVDAIDQLIMRNIWTTTIRYFGVVMNKFMNEVWKCVGTKLGDARFIPEFDVNKDGIIDAVDYKKIQSVLSQGDDVIIDAMEKAIREHPYMSLKGGTNPFPGFDLNGDNRVNSIDQLTMRNIWWISLDRYGPAQAKFMNEVSAHFSIKGDSRYLADLDINKDDRITSVDYLRIRNAIYRGRIEISILADMEKVIRDHSYAPIAGQQNLFTSFDLNGDFRVDSTDQLIMRNIWTTSVRYIGVVMSKFMNEVSVLIGVKQGDPRFIAEFDTNKNGIVDQADYKMIRYVISLGNSKILDDMENVIMSHLWGSISDVSNPSPGFDLNGDGQVSSTDVIMIRNIWSFDSSLFTTVLDKFMSEVTVRVGLKAADPNFIPEFDVDKNGTITAATDRGKILSVLLYGRT